MFARYICETTLNIRFNLREKKKERKKAMVHMQVRKLVNNREQSGSFHDFYGGGGRINTSPLCLLNACSCRMDIQVKRESS